MFSRNEDILNAILNDEDISNLPVPQSREEALLLGILDKIRGGGGGGAGKELIHICTTGEYNQITGVPTVSSPDEGTLYLVPASSATTGNLFDEWVYADSKWERLGSVNVTVPVQDVQVNGVSVLQDGVANVPVANEYGKLGLMKLNNMFGGIQLDTEGNISARIASLKNDIIGTSTTMALPPFSKAIVVFYGLALAAGYNALNYSSVVGEYPESAKSAISEMLNGSVTVSGTAPVITALPGIRYVCGEVATIDITLPASGIVDVVFTSGSTPAVLTVTPPTGQTIKWANGFDPTSLEANTTYEINVADGVYGVVGQWS